MIFAFSDFKRLKIPFNRDWILKNCQSCGSRLCNFGMENLYDTDTVHNTVVSKRHNIETNFSIARGKKAEALKTLNAIEISLKHLADKLEKDGLASA